MGNGHVSIEMADIKREALRFTDSLLNTWDDLLNDPNRLEILYFVFDHYSSLFNKTIDDCVQLMSFDEVCYLLDFDVVRNHVEAGAIDKVDTYLVDHLFYSSKQCYALPAGAFLELLEWLNNLGLIENTLDELKTNLDRETVIYNLANALGISEVRDIKSREAVDEILEKLNEKTLIVNRIYQILTDPRFLGVISSYDEEDAIKLRKMLPFAPRRRLRDRKKVDQRDALNLAIAIKSARNARLAKENREDIKSVGYVLVSQTSTVLKLPVAIQGGSKKERNLLTELCTMLHIKPSILHKVFPVMHPKQIITAELLGIFDNPQKTMLRAISLRSNFQTIVDYLLTQLLISESVSSQDLYKKTFSSFIQQERELISDVFLKVADDLTSAESPLLELEEIRAISESIDYSRAQQQELHFSEEDEIREKSTQFLSLLGHMMSALKEMPGFQYKVKFLPVTQEQPFQCIEVNQEPASNNKKPLLFGEQYINSTAEGGHKYYVIRWPVVCSVDNFAKAMRKIIQPLTNGLSYGAISPMTVSPIPIAEKPEYWHAGIIIHTSDQTFGVPIDLLLYKADGEFLSLKKIRQMIKASLLSSGISTESIPEIQQYRINTPKGDFIFDVIPNEDEKYRYVTVISHYNLSLHIAMLYKLTEMRFVHPLKLSDALADAFGDFKDLERRP